MNPISKGELEVIPTSAEIKLFENTTTKTEITLVKGSTIENLELLEADFATDMIKIKINGTIEGWMKKEKFIESFPSIYNIACCGCG